MAFLILTVRSFCQLQRAWSSEPETRSFLSYAQVVERQDLSAVNEDREEVRVGEVEKVSTDLCSKLLGGSLILSKFDGTCSIPLFLAGGCMSAKACM